MPARRDFIRTMGAVLTGSVASDVAALPMVLRRQNRYAHLGTFKTGGTRRRCISGNAAIRHCFFIKTTPLPSKLVKLSPEFAHRLS
jgi:hypothetical protein